MWNRVDTYHTDIYMSVVGEKLTPTGVGCGSIMLRDSFPVRERKMRHLFREGAEC